MMRLRSYGQSFPVDFHRRMNFPNSTARHVLLPVALVFRSVADIPKRFTNNCDDRQKATGAVPGLDRAAETCHGFLRLTVLTLKDL